MGVLRTPDKVILRTKQKLPGSYEDDMHAVVINEAKGK